MNDVNLILTHRKINCKRIVVNAVVKFAMLRLISIKQNQRVDHSYHNIVQVIMIELSEYKYVS